VVKLSRTQMACIPGLARGDTIEAVAAANKISRRTIERWFERDAAFCEFLKATISQRTDHLLDQHDTALAELASLSAEALKRGLTTPKEVMRTELKAAHIVEIAIARVKEYKNRNARSESK
jgi:hypothetical protein